MTSKHEYFNLQDWEYQSNDNFSTYPFLTQDIKVEEKFFNWISLATSYYSYKNSPDFATKIFTEKLGIRPGSDYEKCLGIYIGRAFNQIAFLKNNFGSIRGKSILDFGSGLGILAVPVVQEEAKYFALEYIKEVAEVRDFFLKKCFESEIFTENDINFSEILLENSNKKFDVIFANNVLSELSEQHITSSVDLIQSMLKKDGVLIMTDWIRSSRKSMLFSDLSKFFFPVKCMRVKEKIGTSYSFLFKKIPPLYSTI